MYHKSRKVATQPHCKKAILMLYFAYKFDLMAACKDGKLIYTNHYNQKNVFQAYEHFSVSDLEKLALVAFDQGSYDHAIDIINAIMDIQESSNITLAVLVSEHL